MSKKKARFELLGDPRYVNPAVIPRGLKKETLLAIEKSNRELKEQNERKTS